jgi:hypothetical protein
MPWGEILDEIIDARDAGVQKPFDAVRRKYLKDLQDETGRDTILYSTAWTLPGGGPDPNTPINNRDIHAFMEVMYGLDGDELDLILHSPGGQAEVAEQIIDYIRQKFDHLRIIVPQAAMSAATLMCCAADEVVMGQHSSLGPIDPQFVMPTPFGYRTTPALAILDQFKMAQDLIDNQSDLIAWQPLLQQYPPGLLAECEEAIELSQQLARQWGERYMHADKKEDEAELRAELMSEYLSDRRRFKSHSRRVSIQEAEENGFDVTPLEEEQSLQDCVLNVFHATMHTHAARPVEKIIENHNQRAVIMRSEGNVKAGETGIEPDDDDEADEKEDD